MSLLSLENVDMEKGEAKLPRELQCIRDLEALINQALGVSWKFESRMCNFVFNYAPIELHKSLYTLVQCPPPKG